MKTNSVQFTKLIIRDIINLLKGGKMKRSEVDRNKLSPGMLQYMEIKDNYEEELLFYRLGDFYELFFDDGLIASRECELTLTGKNAGLDEKIPMCGVPFHSVKPYIEKLVSTAI